MPEPIKNLFSRQFFDALACALDSTYADFDQDAFLKDVFNHQWESLELKERLHHATQCLHKHLPEDYRTALNILKNAAEKLETHGFADMVFSDYVAIYGLDDWDVSLPALEVFTQYVSAEFSVRPFILQDQQRMLAQMLLWADHPSHHVRRLATEGCRPRLPWGLSIPALKKDPAPILPILEKLKNDPNDNVRHCVANNLNDISRDNPHITLQVLQDWQTSEIKDFDYILNRALRTLVKQGHPQALKMLGFSDQPAIKVGEITLSDTTLCIGDSLQFEFVITSTADRSQQLIIDYLVHHMRANGQLIPKVFKLSKKEIGVGETINIRKKHSFQEVTTRRYYPGKHKLEIQINGTIFSSTDFLLTGNK